MTKLSSPAARRNREPIADILAHELPPRGVVLEIASGSGEHVIHFAQRFPHLDFQPSDPDPAARASIAAYRIEVDLPNVRPPVALDASSTNWPINYADAVIAINMLHISPWSAAEGLILGSASILPAGGLLYLYGPYNRAGYSTAPSNMAFDESLKSRNHLWGLRSVEDITLLSENNGFTIQKIIEMPANNLSIVLNKNR